MSSIDGQSVRLDLPTNGGDTERVAVWFHGQGGDANQRMNEDWLNTLRKTGWAVAAGDMQRTGWGNDASVQDAARLVEWAENETGVHASLFIAGSMGALASLGLMADGAATPTCWYGTMPVVDLESVSAVPHATEQISDAWQGATPASPSLSELPSATTYRILSSPDDSWVPAASNADVLYEALTGAGATVTRLETQGEHGDPSHFNTEDLAAFAASCR